jgi:triosephosphate isomerase (TIM)
MNRRPLIAGNWKMYTDPIAAADLAGKLKLSLSGCNWADLAVFPPFTSLANVISALKGTPIHVGGQNLHWEKEGAFTGEISGPMLRSAACDMVLIGHSERRTYFGETDERVNLKLKAALSSGLKPIVCIGESLEQRESGITEKVVESQLMGGLSGMTSLGDIVIAYEPVWAIGTGKNATPEQAADVHKYIRGLIAKGWGEPTAKSIRILYGGSVKADNSGLLWSKEDIDGFLIGGASLKAESFTAIADTVK